MATTKKRRRPAVKRRRKTSTLSAAPKRRTTRRRRRGLSEGGVGGTLIKHAKEQFFGVAGGVIAATVNKMVLPGTSGKMARLGVGIGVGFLAAYMGMPKIGTAFSGGMAALACQNGLLNDDNFGMEDADYANEYALSDAPLFLDEDGSPMVLEEGGDGYDPYYRYLNEDELADYGYYD